MSNRVEFRRFPRPDQPQPVYKAALNLWEAFRFPPIDHAGRNVSVRTPARASLDVRLSEWTPQNGWIARVVDTTVTKWTPAFNAELASFRSTSRAGLNVRGHEWAPDDGWIPTVVDTNVRKWAPIFAEQAHSTRTTDHASLDVRRGEVPGISWIVAIEAPPTVTTAQQWPAILQNLGLSYRSQERARVDVRGHEGFPQDGWRQPVVENIVEQWAGVFASERTDRTPDRPRLDVRVTPWLPDAGAWMAPTLPGATTTAQQWPAVLLDLQPSYRSTARPALDVRLPEWSPSFSWASPVVDRIVASWAPIFGAELGYRSTARAVVDVRSTPWRPDVGPWIFSAANGAAAQNWPAILQNLAPGYRSADRATLDVRHHEWSPQRGWLPSVVDAIVATWAPIFAAELGYRSPSGWPLDVRPGTRDPQIGWWAGFIAFVVTPATADVVIHVRPDDTVIHVRADDEEIFVRPDDDEIET